MSRRNKKMKTVHQPRPSNISLEIAHSSPGDVFKSLIYPETHESFMQNYWEKQPLIIHRENSEQSKLKLENCFSKSALEELVSKEKLQFINDLHACRCIDGKTEDLNRKGRVTLKDLRPLIQMKGATIQFHQPQRFVDGLWNVLEKLESYFGCLVGSNVYITPKGTQGLAPHYDDVEVFIIQLEGEKHWRLYEGPVKLAREYKKDLPPSAYSTPTHEFTLKVGDVLYMPRGTIHQADVPLNGCENSTHITISTYQRHSWGDYLMGVLPRLLEDSMLKSIKLREGLPLNFLTQRDKGKSTMMTLLDELKKGVEDEEFPSSNNLIEDFMTSRLPPFGLDQMSLEETPEGISPTLESSIKLKYPDHVAFCLSEILPGMFDEDDSYDEKDDEPLNGSTGKHVLLYTSLNNSRERHMISSQKEPFIEASGIIKFPSSFLKPLEQLVKNQSAFLPIVELQLDSNAEKIQFATALWTQHIVETK